MNIQFKENSHNGLAVSTLETVTHRSGFKSHHGIELCWDFCFAWIPNKLSNKASAFHFLPTHEILQGHYHKAAGINWSSIQSEITFYLTGNAQPQSKDKKADSGQ